MGTEIIKYTKETEEGKKKAMSMEKCKAGEKVKSQWLKVLLGPTVPPRSLHPEAVDELLN